MENVVCVCAASLVGEVVSIETWVSCVWWFGESVRWSPLKWPRGELRARCRELNCASRRHSQFWGWHKVVPVRGMLNVSNLYSTLQGIHKLDRFPHVSILLLLLKSRQWDVCTGRRCPAKKAGFGSLPNFCCPGKEVRNDRIGHPDWVKLCVVLNYFQRDLIVNKKTVQIRLDTRPQVSGS